MLEDYWQAPQELQAAATDVAGLQLAPNEIRDAISGSELNQDRQRDLKRSLTGGIENLKELLHVLERLKSLATSSHRPWEVFRWDKKRVKKREFG